MLSKQITFNLINHIYSYVYLEGVTQLEMYQIKYIKYRSRKIGIIIFTTSLGIYKNHFTIRLIIIVIHNQIIYVVNNNTKNTWASL